MLLRVEEECLVSLYLAAQLAAQAATGQDIKHSLIVLWTSAERRRLQPFEATSFTCKIVKAPQRSQRTLPFPMKPQCLYNL